MSEDTGNGKNREKKVILTTLSLDILFAQERADPSYPRVSRDTVRLSQSSWFSLINSFSAKIDHRAKYILKYVQLNKKRYVITMLVGKNIVKLVFFFQVS